MLRPPVTPSWTRSPCLQHAACCVRSQRATTHELPRNHSRSWVRALCLSLVVASAGAQATELQEADGALALPAPLTAEAFLDAVVAHNASLEAMRQASIAAVAQVK